MKDMGWGEVEGRHYGFLAFLTLLNVMNFVDRQLLSSFANFIVPDLGLSNTQFGLLTGLVFIFFYATMGLFMGALADMVHRPRLVAAGLALWSVLTAASGAARGFMSLAIPRMFIGVGESALTPTSMSMLSDRFPTKMMGFASGFYYMGVPVGVGVSLLVVGYLGPAIGWRNCFYALGAIGIALAIAMLFVKETPRKHLITEKETKISPDDKPARPDLREIAKSLIFAMRTAPALGYTIAGGVAVHFILGAAAFEQLWFVRERGFDAAEIARITGYIGITGGVLGNLVGGIGSDLFMKRTGLGRPMFLFWVMIVAVPIGLLYRVSEAGSALFWFGIFLGFFQLGAFYGPTFSTIQELVPPQIRATVVAFYILMLNLIGLGIGITAAGWTIDHLISLGVSEPYTKTLVGFTILSASAIPLFYIAGKRFSKDRDRLFEVIGLSSE